MSNNIKYCKKVKQLFLFETHLGIILLNLNMKIPANIFLTLNRKVYTYSSRDLYKNLQRIFLGPNVDIFAGKILTKGTEQYVQNPINFLKRFLDC